MKSPQERRIEELEQQIKVLRERTEGMQHEWLRLQGHVVKLAEQHQKMLADINLINKRKRNWSYWLRQLNATECNRSLLSKSQDKSWASILRSASLSFI